MTFSAAVDLLVSRMRLPQRRFDTAVAAVNSALQSLAQIKYFNRDALEDELLISDVTLTNYIWTLPFRFRRLASAKYLPDEIIPEEIDPSCKQIETNYLWHRTSDYIAFKGIQNQTSIAVQYIRFPRKFRYYALAARPATFNLDTETYQFLPSFNTSDALRAQALDLTTHWLLEHYQEIVIETAMSDIRKDLGHPTARSLFAKATEYANRLQKEESYLNISDRAHAFSQ